MWALYCAAPMSNSYFDPALHSEESGPAQQYELNCTLRRMRQPRIIISSMGLHLAPATKARVQRALSTVLLRISSARALRLQTPTAHVIATTTLATVKVKLRDFTV
jgi:hypothetical protein